MTLLARAYKPPHALFLRLTHRPWLPPIMDVAAVVLAAWLATALLALIPVWHGPLVDTLSPIVQALGFGSMAIAPSLTAAYAAYLAALEVRSPEHQLLRLTTIPRKTIVRDFFHAALFRLRWLYAFILAVLPAMIGLGLAQAATFSGRFSISASGIMVLAYAAWMALATGLGGSLGVYAALRWRGQRIPIVAAPVALMVFMALNAVCLTCALYVTAPLATTWLLNQGEKWA